MVPRQVEPFHTRIQRTSQRTGNLKPSAGDVACTWDRAVASGAFKVRRAAAEFDVGSATRLNTGRALPRCDRSPESQTYAGDRFGRTPQLCWNG